MPGSNEQIAITNRHRIMRVGRVYQEKAGEKPGLLFMCLNGDIERQFEFVQQTWLMSPSFHGLSCEKDPVLGDGETGACGFTDSEPPWADRAQADAGVRHDQGRRLFLHAGQASDRVSVRDDGTRQRNIRC